MKRYKLSTGLWTVKELPLFDNDKDAWEYLRLKLPNKFAVLYREDTATVPYNNCSEYIEIHNKKYGPQPHGNGGPWAKLKTEHDKDNYLIWVPILEGLTNDSYNA